MGVDLIEIRISSGSRCSGLDRMRFGLLETSLTCGSLHGLEVDSQGMAGPDVGRWLS
jgi:hypothetical protein